MANIYGDSTFKTGIDFAVNGAPSSSTFPRVGSMGNSLPGTGSNIASFEEELLKLPNVVNYVALRETFLSEAPFIKRSNRPFWKKWIDSKQYLNVFAASLRIVSDCITDNGVIHADKLFRIPTDKKITNATRNSAFFDTGEGDDGGSKFISRATMIRVPGNTTNSAGVSFQNWLNTTDIQALLTEKIATNISEMLMMDRNKRSFTNTHDLLFYRLPEILSYMTLQSLLATIPKLARVFNSIKFRELLLDWFTELINGIKITDCHNDREWIFKNTSDNPIILLNEPVNLSKSLRRINAEEKKKVQQERKKTLRLEAMNGLSRNSTPFTPSNKGISYDSYEGNNNSSRIGSPLMMSSPQQFFNATSSSSANRHNAENNTEAGDSESVAASTSQLPALLNNRFGAARSTVVLQNSPLVAMYMNSGAKVNHLATSANLFEDSRKPQPGGYVCQNQLKLTMSHLPNRPIISMQSDIVHQEGKFREKKVDSSFLRKTLVGAVKSRNDVLEKKDMSFHEMKYDVARINKAYKIQLNILENKPVTQKELLMAATALESFGKLTSSAPNLSLLKAGSNITNNNNSVPPGLSQNSMSGNSNTGGGEMMISANNSIISEN
jgi:predicted nucleic acid-binding protein